MMTINEFPENRYRHSYSVGKKMYQYAKEKLHFTETDAINMFVLGNLHDIGYEFSGDDIGHGEIISTALKNTYAYHEAIYNHSFLVNTDGIPIELKLLYFADSTVDGEGNWVTFDERVADLISRHGEQSASVQHTKQIIDQLKKWGFDDKSN